MEKGLELEEKSGENSGGLEEAETKMSAAPDESHSEAETSANEDETRLENSLGKSIIVNVVAKECESSQRLDENSDSIVENVSLDKPDGRVLTLGENDDVELDGLSSSTMLGQTIVEQSQKASVESHQASFPARATKKKGRQTTPGKSSHTNESGLESSSSSGQKRRKKDPMAPKAPLNAYLLYFNEERSDMRQKNPGMSFGELTKIIATKWKDLSGDEKQRYINEAEMDKERYSKEMADYKKSDAYKQYLKEGASSKSKSAGGGGGGGGGGSGGAGSVACVVNEEINGASIDVVEASTSSNTATASTNQTPNINWLQHESNIAGFDVPIFTEEFLEHSKAREQEMRQLRKEVAELEQQNSFLQKHLETMNQSSAKIHSDMEKLKISTGAAQKHADMFKQTMLHCFGNLPLPNSQEYPTPANIDEYIMKLYSMLANHQMDNNNGVNSQFVMHVKSTLSKINFSSLFDAI